MKRLILIPTRQCNLRCSYCPTVKDGWPTLSPADALRGIDLFLAASGGGDVKLFGGEPLLAPDVVDAVVTRAADDPRIQSVTLCTNGIGLDESWLERIRSCEKLVVAVSLDGTPEDNRRFRRQLVDDDAYDHVAALAARLARLPRVVVTEVIPPATASRAHINFQHLLSLGFRRLKLLPAYYVPWSETQLASLRAGFEEIAGSVRAMWRSGQHVYIRNLFSLSAQPTFNSAMTIDADGRIYSSDFVLTGISDDARDSMCLGTMDSPPTLRAIVEGARAFEESIGSYFSPTIWSSTLRADAELTRFCRTLYPAWRQWRERRNELNSRAPSQSIAAH